MPPSMYRAPSISTAGQIPGTAQLAAIAPTKLAALGTAEFANFSASQLGALTTAQIQALTTQQLSLLSSAQLGALTAQDLAALKTARDAGARILALANVVDSLVPTAVTPVMMTTAMRPTSR